MQQEQPGSGVSRRELLKMIGITAGLQNQGLGTNLFEVHRVP